MGLAVSALILPMINLQMLSIANVDEAVIAKPPIGAYDPIEVYLSTNDPLQSGLRVIGDNFGVHAVDSLEKIETDGFTVDSSSPLAFYKTGAE